MIDASTIIFLWGKLVGVMSGIALGLGLFVAVNSTFNLFYDILEEELDIKRNVAEFVVAGILIKIGLIF